MRRAAHVFGLHSTKLPPVADTGVGAPTPKALSSQQTKVERLKQVTGPDSVVLSANEVASLIGSSMDWSVRKSFDSLRVELSEGSLAVHCRLDTRVIPPDALGPIAGFLSPREPLRIAGPLRIERPGLARFTVEELSLRGIPFPPPIVKRSEEHTSELQSTGAVPLRVSPGFADVRIHPTAEIGRAHV